MTTAITSNHAAPRATVRPTAHGIRIECETLIQAPPAVVWDAIQEPDRRVEWDARLTNCTLLSARPLGKGSRIRTAYALLGWVDSEYTSWQPVQRSAVKCVGTSRGNPIRSFVASWNFTPAADGATVWKTQIVLKGVGSARVAPLIERLMIGPLMGWLTKKSARNLQALVEREYREAAQAVTVAA
jgi:uncharacterized protein YndB with AHSA1/START domain